MNCKKVRSLYTDYHDKGIDKDTENGVLDHISKCEDCRKLYERLDTITSYAGKYENLSPETGLVEKMLDRVDSIPHVRTFAKTRWIVAYAVIFLLITCTSFGIFLRMNKKKQMLAKKKQEELYFRNNRYILDYGQFEKGKVIYRIPSNDYSVKVIEVSY